MASRLQYGIVAATVACLPSFLVTGCTPEIHRYMRFPDLTNPGPAPYQRAEFVRHDPYPLNDVGPEIEGGRPREYQQPVNEVARARMNGNRPVTTQPIPLQPLPGAPPPVVVTPPVVTTPSPVAVPPPLVTAPAPASPFPSATPSQIQPRAPY